MAEEKHTDTLSSSGNGTYDSHNTRRSNGTLFPGLMAKDYPLWSKRSVRRKKEQEAKDSWSEKGTSKVSNVLEEFGDATSIQGIPFAKKARSPAVKVFWSLVIVIGVVLSVLHSYSVYQEFVAYGTTSTVSISHSTLNFPSVTFCNNNPLRYSKVREFGSEQLKQFIERIKPRSEFMVQMPRQSDGASGGNRRKKRQVKKPPIGSSGMTPKQPSSPHQFTDTLGPIETTVTTSTASAANPERGYSDTVKPDTNALTSNTVSVKDTSQTTTGQPSSPSTENQHQGNTPTAIPSSSEEPHEDSNDNTYDTDESEERDFFPAGEPLSTDTIGFNVNDNEEIINEEKTSGFLKLKVLLEEYLSHIQRKSRRTLAHSLGEMLLSCSYDGKVCGPRNFTTFAHHEYGFCWTFNSRDILDQPLLSVRSGANFGLSLMLNIQAHDYLPGLTDSRGIRVSIHNFGTMPFPAEGGLSVAAGTQTFVSLKKISQTRLGGRYGECSDMGKFERYYSKFDYTLQGCINTCLDRNISVTCGCYRATRHLYYSEDDLYTLQRCKREDQNCTSPLRKAYESGEMDCSCRQACHTIDYDAQISNDVWPDDSLWWALIDAACTRDEENCDYMRSIPRMSHEKFLLNNFLHLKIYYRDLNVENINEAIAYDVYQFVADFGGAVGLWLGASAITLFEVADLVLHFIIYLFMWKKVPEKAKSKEDSEIASSVDVDHSLRLSNYLPKYHSNFYLGSQNNLDDIY